MIKFLKVVIIIILSIIVLSIVILIINHYQENKKFVLKTNLETENQLQEILEKRVDGKNIFSGTVRIESGDGSFQWQACAGSFDENKDYIAASITKLYTAAVILRLYDEGKLSLQDNLGLYLSEETLTDLHIYKGVDYSKQLTIENLLFQTSGLPDYFEEKNKNGESLIQHLMTRGDVNSSVEEAINIAKELNTHFIPLESRKSYYSDINFDLLGLIIEKVSGIPLEQAYEDYIFEPLELTETFLMTKEKNTEEFLNKMQPVYVQSNTVIAPLYLASFPASGGIVSNSKEQMIFLKAFFQGKLFSKDNLNHICNFRKITSPGMTSLEYGGGLMRSKLVKPVAIFFPKCTIIGHSGASSSFAFYCPEKDLYITGTLNQMSNPGYPFYFMMQLLNVF
ncbi:serine hydrolase domain-containing protein [Anaerocolumna sp.]|uniref:serine hydrolase domain-containing protein n=1 Tax=Anaerocolumna sp. TaxID=2041569 RepID=UPI0028ADD24E|nr:serine hydrolase [Anaerocolumna sp.]